MTGQAARAPTSAVEGAMPSMRSSRSPERDGWRQNAIIEPSAALNIPMKGENGKSTAFTA